MTKIDILRNIILNSKHLVFFGGAGVSTASNIPDFRSSNGIYNEKYGTIPIESIISHSFFMSHPDIFYNVYKEKLCFPDALPNDCHKVLAKLEQMGILKSVITQNIDDLHEKAGTKNIYKLHGSVTINAGGFSKYTSSSASYSDGTSASNALQASSFTIRIVKAGT